MLNQDGRVVCTAANECDDVRPLSLKYALLFFLRQQGDIPKADTVTGMTVLPALIPCTENKWVAQLRLMLLCVQRVS
jgi:hypothetical protein